MTREAINHELVLIVDDVPENLAVLSDALDEAGYMVLVATDGVSAIDTLDRVTPHIILMDAVMPGIDGFETCRRIKAQTATRSIPVIFMTGLTETEHVVRGFEAGGVDYVTKPIHPDEVLARVRAHLRTARVITQTREAVDAVGLAIIVLDLHGRAAWQTLTARTLLEKFFGPIDGDNLPDQVRTWSTTQIAGPNPLGFGEPLVREVGEETLSIYCVGTVADQEPVLLLRLNQNHLDESKVKRAFSLTAREVEVLSWLAKGKTNRDIADILGMSHRTVNKHLEHIYTKLGVETRTAAAAFASAIL